MKIELTKDFRVMIEIEAENIIMSVMSGSGRFPEDDSKEAIGWYDRKIGRFTELDQLVRKMSDNKFYLSWLGEITEVTD